MDMGVTSAILGSVVSLSVAIAILLRQPRRSLYVYFASLTFSLLLWHASSLASRVAGATVGQIQTIAILFIPPTAALFFRELLHDTGFATRGLVRAAFVISGVLFAVSVTPWGGAWLVRGAIVVYVAISLLAVARSLYLRMRAARSESDRRRLRYLLYGGVGAALLAAGEFIPDLALPSALGHVAVALYIYLIYQSIIARRMIQLSDILGKLAVLSALTLMLAAVYALLVRWVGAEQQGLWLFNTLVASFVILILYDQVRPWVEETTARLILHERRELPETVNKILPSLRTTIDIEEMAGSVIDALHGSGRAVNAALYLPTDGDVSFALFGHRGAAPPQVLSAAEQPHLVNELRREHRPILLEHLQLRYDELPALSDQDATTQRELDRCAEAIADMRALHADLVVPMLAGESVVGILSLGVDANARPYSTIEIASILSLAETCATIIENSQEFERLRERDRLVAVGELAAGMAHEIRNPLGAIKGAAQCIDPAKMPGESSEFLDVIVEEVDRLDGVVSQFLEYARPLRGELEATDANHVVTATLRLLGRDAIPSNIEVVQDLAHDLPPVHANGEQLKQVLINLLLNAIQAMPGGGTIRIATVLAQDHSGDFTGEMFRAARINNLMIRISDTGEGIPAEDRSRVFLPFFTTKQRGTGLGLAISQRIIESFGGRIQVASRSGEGTTFTIRLPLAPSLEQADHPAELPSPQPLPALGEGDEDATTRH